MRCYDILNDAQYDAKRQHPQLDCHKGYPPIRRNQMRYQRTSSLPSVACLPIARYPVSIALKGKLYAGVTKQVLNVLGVRATSEQDHEAAMRLD
jgi:hypothetical protein